MKNTLSIMSDLELIKIYQTTFDKEIIETLLERHSALIKTLAKNHTTQYPATCFEDNIQNARVGFIGAMGRFKDTGVKLTTFLYSSIFYHLLSCNDKEAFVNCPSNLREVRSFVGGKYDKDTDRKQAFKKRHNLTNQDSIDSFVSKHSLLAPDSIVCTEILPEKTYDHEKSMINDLYVQMVIEKMPDEEKYIAGLLMQGHTPPQIAEMYSIYFGVPCSGKLIRSKISHMKHHFSV